MNGRKIGDVIGVVVFLVFCAFLVLGIARCKPAENPRAQARSVVYTIAEGVKSADKACADIARAKKDAELARACDLARDEAAEVLIAADEALDSADAAKAGDVPCMVAQAVASASRLMGLIERAGGKVPNALKDGLDLAPLLAGGCHG